MQNLDDSADKLLYSCAGMIPDPEEAAAAAVGLESTVTSAEAVPVNDTAGGAAAAETPHHHHHHHRHLAQTPSSEIANAWTVSKHAVQHTCASASSRLHH